MSPRSISEATDYDTLGTFTWFAGQFSQDSLWKHCLCRVKSARPYVLDVVSLQKDRLAAGDRGDPTVEPV